MLYAEPLRCAVLVPWEKGKVLMAEWKTGVNQGRLGCPGGKINSVPLDNVWESPQEAAIREAKEEAGIVLPAWTRLQYLGGVCYLEGEDNNKRECHTDFFLVALKEELKYVQNLEPDKLGEWNWVSVSGLHSKRPHDIYYDWVFPRVRKWENAMYSAGFRI